MRLVRGLLLFNHLFLDDLLLFGCGDLLFRFSIFISSCVFTLLCVKYTLDQHWAVVFRNFDVEGAMLVERRSLADHTSRFARSGDVFKVVV